MKKVADFTIEYSQYLDENGQLADSAPEVANQAETLVEMYKAMLLTRTFDKKAIALQRTGKMGTYPSSNGQEAISVSVGTVMRDEDVLIPYYREYGAQFIRGVTMKEILLYWGGDERGMDYQGPRQDFPISVPIASQATHAVGVGYAFKLRKEPRVAVVFFGDGSTSKGDFYEAVNAAGLWKLPIVFVVNNNQWAISIRREHQTASETIAQKGIAGGVPGQQVDGNDIIALHEIMSQAIEKARRGEGPSVIEAVTYRLCDHTTADDATRYRPQEEVDAAKEREPVKRLKAYLLAKGFWDEAQEQQFLEECSKKVEAEVEAYLNTAAQPPETMFDYMFETIPHDLAEQKASFMKREK